MHVYETFLLAVRPVMRLGAPSAPSAFAEATADKPERSDRATQRLPAVAVAKAGATA